jgi:hypothetical protein
MWQESTVNNLSRVTFFVRIKVLFPGFNCLMTFIIKLPADIHDQYIVDNGFLYTLI